MRSQQGIKMCIRDRSNMDYNRETENKRLLYSKLSDKIYQYIKDENLRPGDKLPGERKLAAEWKVSRPSLREAIRELENQGIVHAEVGKGTFVTDYVEGRQFSIHLALKNFLELFEVKTVLERYSLEKAIPNISEERLNQLEDMAVQMNAIASTGIMPKEMDHHFHRYILECYGNQEMTNLAVSYTHLDVYKRQKQDLLRQLKQQIQFLLRPQSKTAFVAQNMMHLIQ